MESPIYTVLPDIRSILGGIATAPTSQLPKPPLGACSNRSEDYSLINKSFHTPNFPSLMKFLKKDFLPDANLNIVCLKRLVKHFCLTFIALLLAEGTIYALFHTGERTKASHFKKHGLYQMRMREVINSAQKLYNSKIILHQSEIGEKLCSGAVDRQMPLKEFLRNLTSVMDLEFHIDSSQVIHIKRAQTPNSKHTN